MFTILLFIVFAGSLASSFCFFSACYSYIEYTLRIKRREQAQAKRREAAERFWKSMKVECVSYDEN